MSAWLLLWCAIAYALIAFLVIKIGNRLAMKRERRHLNELYRRQRDGRKL